MRIQISKKTLVGATTAMSRIIPSRSSNPVLTALHIEAGTNGLIFTGTNLEMDLRLKVPAEISLGSSGAFVVPAHLFAGIVGSLGGELVELELLGNLLHIRAAGSAFKLQTGDVSTYPYPAMEFKTDAIAFQIDPTELLHSIDATRYAASNEAFQAVFRGLKLELRTDHTRIAASDGFRLALRDIAPLDGVTGDGQDVIIPARSCDEIRAQLAKATTCTLAVRHGLVVFQTERLTLQVKLLDGDFPDYERVIPKDIRLTAALPAAQFKESLQRVAFLADKNANNRVEIIISEGVLRLSAGGEYGDAQDTLSVTQEGSEPAMSLGFNARYLLDAIGSVTGDLTLSLSGETTPALITSAGDTGLRAVVVPLRV